MHLDLEPIKPVGGFVARVRKWDVAAPLVRTAHRQEPWYAARNAPSPAAHTPQNADDRLRRPPSVSGRPHSTDRTCQRSRSDLPKLRPMDKASASEMMPSSPILSPVSATRSVMGTPKNGGDTATNCRARDRRDGRERASAPCAFRVNRLNGGARMGPAVGPDRVHKMVNPRLTQVGPAVEDVGEKVLQAAHAHGVAQQNHLFTTVRHGQLQRARQLRPRLRSTAARVSVKTSAHPPLPPAAFWIDAGGRRPAPHAARAC